MSGLKVEKVRGNILQTGFYEMGTEIGSYPFSLAVSFDVVVEECFSEIVDQEVLDRYQSHSKIAPLKLTVDIASQSSKGFFYWVYDKPSKRSKPTRNPLMRPFCSYDRLEAAIKKNVESHLKKIVSNYPREFASILFYYTQKRLPLRWVEGHGHVGENGEWMLAGYFGSAMSLDKLLIGRFSVAIVASCNVGMQEPDRIGIPVLYPTQSFSYRELSKGSIYRLSNSELCGKIGLDEQKQIIAGFFSGILAEDLLKAGECEVLAEGYRDACNSWIRRAHQVLDVQLPQ